MLGLLPGAGGTQRLPKLVGIQQALTMATTGQNIKPSKAKKMGLVDNVADPAALRDAALLAVRGLMDGSIKAQPKKKALMNRLLEDNAAGRSILFQQAEKQIMKQAGTNYPAPMEILRCIRTGVEQGPEAGFREERERFGRLGMTPQSRALRGIYHGQTELKKNPYGAPKHPIQTLAVLGAGLMGSGIAQVSAVQGNARVLLKDKDNKGLARGIDQMEKNLMPKVKKRRMTKFEMDRAMSQITGLTDESASLDAHLRQADGMIEAVFEDLELKQKIFREMESKLPSHAVLASNTSAIPIRSIAEGVKDPSRVIGMHYFSPVDKMPLLEIIPHQGTAPEIVSAAFDLGRRQGKTVIVVKDVPGFFVNRSLGPYMAETMVLLAEGVDPAKLDKAMKSFGFPVGPITLADEVGIDVAQHVQTFLADDLGARMAGAIPEAMQEMASQGLHGRKSGKGFFTYATKKQTPLERIQSIVGMGPKQGRQVNPDARRIMKKYAKSDGRGDDISVEEIQERMSLRFIKEAMHCLEDGIISSPMHGDMGSIFGIGYPPFRGGPFMQADIEGADKLMGKMQSYADKHGAHFAPPQILQDHAKSGKKFRQ